MGQKDEYGETIKKLRNIAILSAIFMAVEIVGGYVANSLAIMADALHLLSDVLAYMISLYAILLSKKLAPKYFPFGYEKVQPLGALINVGLIWVVTLQLAYEATQRIIYKSVVKQPFYMLLTSIFGLGCNLFIMSVLHSSQGGHGCGHNHGSSNAHSHGAHQHKDQKSHDHNHSHDHSHDHDHDHSHENHSENGKNTKHQKCNHEHHQHKNHVHTQKDQKHNHANCNQNHSQKQKKPKTKVKINKQEKYVQIKQQLQSLQLQQYLQQNKGCCSKSQTNPQVRAFLAQKIEVCSDSHHDDDHGHGHGHSHDQSNKKKGSSFSNMNIEAAYVHIISDIILSIGVILSASLIYFFAPSSKKWSYWQLADPFCTYFFSIMAIYSTISICKESLTILLGGCADKELPATIQNKIKKYGQIEQLRVWSINRGKNYATLKVRTHSQQDYNKIVSIFAQNQISATIQNKLEKEIKIQT